MPEIGEIVQVHYVGTFDDGTVFDSSLDRGEPLEFTMGSHAVLPMFEKAVIEMQVGERKQLHLRPTQAYGERDESLVLTAPRGILAGGPEATVGQKLRIMTKMGPVTATIVELNDKVVKVDCNHDLAGKALNFDIELIAVKHESAVEHELHGEGCACGCHRLKKSLESA